MLTAVESEANGIHPESKAGIVQLIKGFIEEKGFDSQCKTHSLYVRHIADNSGSAAVYLVEFYTLGQDRIVIVSAHPAQGLETLFPGMVGLVPDTAKTLT